MDLDRHRSMLSGDKDTTRDEAKSVEPWLSVLERSAEHHALLVAYCRAAVWSRRVTAGQLKKPELQRWLRKTKGNVLDRG